ARCGLPGKAVGARWVEVAAADQRAGAVGFGLAVAVGLVDHDVVAAGRLRGVHDGVGAGPRVPGVAAAVCGDADAGPGLDPVAGDDGRAGHGRADCGRHRVRVLVWGDQGEFVAALADQ